MAAFAPRSNAALRIDADLHLNMTRLLVERGFPGARVVKAERLNDDVCECLFTVPRDGRRVAQMAWVCRSGSVQIMEGWPVL
jgi:hypothetical protein